MEFLRLWEITMRRKYIFLTVFAIIFGTVMVAAFLIPPTYEARTKMLVGSSRSLGSVMAAIGVPMGATSSSGASSTLKGQENIYANEIVLATIRPASEKLISELELTTASGAPLEPTDLIRSPITIKFRPRPFVEVDQFEDTDMLEIVARAADPDEATNMANRLAELFIEARLAETREDYRTAGMFIDAQMDDVKDEYYRALEKRKDFMLETQTVDLDREIQLLLNLVSELKKEYDANEIAIAQAKHRLQLVEDKIGGKGFDSGSIASTLESRLAEAIVDMSGVRILSASKPDIDELNRRVSTVREIISGKADIILNKETVAVGPIYADLIHDLKDAWINHQVAETKRAILRVHIDEYQSELIELPIKGMGNAEIQLLLNVQQNMYSSILEYRTQVGLAEVLTIADFKVVEPAVLSDASKPVFPKRALAGVFGIVMGLFWAFALAFFVEYIDTSVNTPRDLTEAGLSVLGCVPRAGRNPLISGLAQEDPVFDSYTRVVAGIDFARVDDPPKKLVVSGIEPRSGSSSVSVNLAIVYAREGRKVLLVDTDLRGGSLHEKLRMGNERGLSDLLLGDASAEAAIQDTHVPGLSLLASGSAPGDSGLVLRSSKLEGLIQQLSEGYDVLVFDAAAILSKSDSALLLRHLDGLILVARTAKTSRQAVAKANDLLKKAKIAPLGVVLNYFERASLVGRKRNGDRAR